MAISLSERSPDMLQIIKDAIQGELANLWTSLPCIVDSYNPDAVTVVVHPAIKIPVKKIDGSVELVQMPLLMDVPVMFPCAG